MATSGSWLCISSLINTVSGAEMTLPIFCVWGPTRSCLRVPWQDPAFKPKFTAPASTTGCFHTCSWFLLCAWLRPWNKFLSFRLSHLFLQKLPILLTHFLSSCSIMPGSLSAWWLSLSSLLVPRLFSCCEHVLPCCSGSSLLEFSLSHAKGLASVLSRVCGSVLLSAD